MCVYASNLIIDRMLVQNCDILHKVCRWRFFFWPMRDSCFSIGFVAVMISDDIFDIVPFGWTSSTANAHTINVIYPIGNICAKICLATVVTITHTHTPSLIRLFIWIYILRNFHCVNSYKIEFSLLATNRTQVQFGDLNSEWSKTFTQLTLSIFIRIFSISFGSFGVETLLEIK